MRHQRLLPSCRITLPHGLCRPQKLPGAWRSRKGLPQNKTCQRAAKRRRPFETPPFCSAVKPVLQSRNGASGFQSSTGLKSSLAAPQTGVRLNSVMATAAAATGHQSQRREEDLAGDLGGADSIIAISFFREMKLFRQNKSRHPCWQGAGTSVDRKILRKRACAALIWPGFRNYEIGRASCRERV